MNEDENTVRPEWEAPNAGDVWKPETARESNQIGETQELRDMTAPTSQENTSYGSFEDVSILSEQQGQEVTRAASTYDTAPLPTQSHIQGTAPTQAMPVDSQMHAYAQGSSSTPQSNVFATGDATSYGDATRGARAAKTAKQTSAGPGWMALIIAMVVTALVTGGGVWAAVNYAGTSSASRSSSQTAASPAQTVPTVPTSGDKANWQAVAQAVSPAVVTINSVSQSNSGVGSGVIYNKQGDIITNYHVISSAVASQGSLSVTLADGRIYDAEVVGYDQTTDLAVIRLINAPSDLTVANFGSSSNLAVGQEVMAIGAPLGLSNTVTTGIISALDRPVEVSAQSEREPQQNNPLDPFNQLPNLQEQNQNATSESVITNAIQVDASINPGNSGGPLFNSNGAVIGINSSIASMGASSSDSAGSIGLGFAIPADLAKSVADQLIEKGTADHAVLGVSIRTGQVNVDGTTKAAAEVADVVAGGGAANAGIQVGDVITAVNGSKVSSSKQLTGYIRRYKGGDQVTVEYVRGGQVREATVTLTSQS